MSADAPRATGASTTGGIGMDRVRVDAPLKVTGKAPYAYEQPVENPVYLFPLVSTIARGTVRRIDSNTARRVPGILLVLTHENAPKLRIKTDAALYILQSPRVHYRGQYLGAVVAETPEAARHAASLVEIQYDEEAADLTFREDHPNAYIPKRTNAFKQGKQEKGDIEVGMCEAVHTLVATYTTPNEHHNPIEPHVVIAIWHSRRWYDLRSKRLTLYDANQGTASHQLLLAPLLGLLPSQLEVISPYVGGSFGTKGWPHSHLVLAALAAKLLPGRSVKYAMTRQQMFRTTGYRPHSVQHIRMGADTQGRLTAIEHESIAPTARLKEFVEQTVSASRMMYAAPHRRTVHRAVPLDIAPGIFMRAPGEFTGMFALETAMDELAETCGIDPIELRVRNEPCVDPENEKPYSTRNLIACLTQGAKRFGWDERLRPGKRRDGEWQIGMGVASATYPNQHLVSLRARIRYESGRYFVELQASDIGTGARTILPQIAADALGVPVDQVEAEIGRTGLPIAVPAGGSMGTYEWGDSIVAAARKFRRKHGINPADGARASARGKLPKGYKNYSRHAFGATFAQVRVSEVTGEVRVDRMLGVYAAGTIINPRTARSQFLGGMTMGLSAALHEESYLDPRFGHVVNADLAGYHIATHADVHDIDVVWIPEFDPWFGATGAKGIGEIGIVGVPAAIGNAIFNATGKRLRDLPFTPDKLVGR